jgi:hypothetical protein
MNPHPWFRTVFASRTPRTIRKAPTRPQMTLEALEDRCLLRDCPIYGRMFIVSRKSAAENPRKHQRLFGSL